HIDLYALFQSKVLALVLNFPVPVFYVFGFNNHRLNFPLRLFYNINYKKVNKPLSLPAVLTDKRNKNTGCMELLCKDSFFFASLDHNLREPFSHRSNNDTALFELFHYYCRQFRCGSGNDNSIKRRLVLQSFGTVPCQYNYIIIAEPCKAHSRLVSKYRNSFYGENLAGQLRQHGRLIS